MDKYLVTFETTEGDIETEWTFADSSTEAVELIREGNWTFKQTLEIRKYPAND